LNLLRTSRLHPQLSAAAHYHGLVDYNKTAFAPPGCKIIAHEKPGKRRTWDPHGQHGYSLGPAMHHYRCQNVYISTTASEHIVDTLEFFPHNYQMPQLSSTDRLLMAAKDMTDAFRNPHPDVPFASVGDDTIAALADLAAIFKLKLQQAPSPETHASTAKFVQCPSLIPSSTKILNSPMPNSQQTRSQTTIHTQDNPNVPLPLRVVTPRTLHHSPPRVPTGPLAPGDSRLATCLKMTFVEWTQPIWRLPSEITIGFNGTIPTQSSTPSPENKWNTRLS
jgi:hypothetical protein